MAITDSEPIAHAVGRIPDQAVVLARSGLHRGVHKMVSIFHSHYSKIDYKQVCEGWAPGCVEEKTDPDLLTPTEIEEMMLP